MNPVSQRHNHVVIVQKSQYEVGKLQSLELKSHGDHWDTNNEELKLVSEVGTAFTKFAGDLVSGDSILVELSPQPKLQSTDAKSDLIEPILNDAAINVSSIPRLPETSILDFPDKVRATIWLNLPYSDTLTLRKVCQAFKTDIDYVIGIHWRIAETFQGNGIKWFQTVTVRSCIVETFTPLKLKSGIFWKTKELHIHDFLMQPLLVQELRIYPDYSFFIEECKFLPVSQCINIMNRCCRLVVLKIRAGRLASRSTSSPKDEIHLPEEVDLLSEPLLQSLKNQTYLRTLEIIIGHCDDGCHLGFKSYPTKSQLHRRKFRVPFQLTEFIFTFPFVCEKWLPQWKSFMEKQKSLTILSCNFGYVYWDFYSTVISINSSTLRKVILRRLINHNLKAKTAKEFDWNIFSNCTKLKYLKVSCAEKDADNLYEHDSLYNLYYNNRNFEKLPLEHLEELYLTTVSLENSQVETMKMNARNLRVFQDNCDDDDEFALHESRHQDCLPRVYKEEDRFTSFVKSIINF